MVENEEVIIIGAGPCGLACALSFMEKGYQPLVIEKDNVVSSIYRYPTHQTFFSTSEKLEIGDVPFVTVERKPKRNQALSYYRDVVSRKNIRVHSFEKVAKVEKQNDGFMVHSTKRNGEDCTYHCRQIVVATGYYDNPNMMNIPGEEKEHVFHYFKEAHPFFGKDVVVIGGKNSAIDAAMELERVGARVTVLYRGSEYSSSIKPWILPEFISLVNHELVEMVFEADVEEITENELIYSVHGEQRKIKADFVFAMTGYHPDHSFLTEMGVEIEEDTGRPIFDPETMETNAEGIFIAGVIAAGNNANEIFIENGRFHGDLISEEVVKRDKKRGMRSG